MVVPVKVSKAQAGVLGEGKIYTGVVTPAEKVNIVPMIAGKVVELPVDVGSEVKKGQVLFKLEDNDLRNNLAKAKAAASAASASVSTTEASRESGIVSATSGVVSSKNGVISSKSAINQAQGGISQAQTVVEQAKNGLSSAVNTVKQTEQAFADAQKTLTRTQALFNAGSVAQAQLEQAQTAVVSAQTARDNAVNARLNAEKQLSASQEALTVAQQSYKNATSSYENASNGYSNSQRQLKVSQNTATIESSREMLKQAQLNVSIAQDALNDSVITSPINGIVGGKNAEIGEIVSAAAPVLVIANLSTVNTLIYVPADQINHIQVDDKVQVRVTASDLITTGIVKSVSPLDSSGKGYPVKISVANPEMKLKSGMLADISFVNNVAKQGMIVPSGAVLKTDGKAYVFVVSGGHVARKEVTVASESGSQALITSGIAQGATVAINNLSLLADNVAVRMTP